jgi:hypothetical protein
VNASRGCYSSQPEAYRTAVRRIMNDTYELAGTRRGDRRRGEDHSRHPAARYALRDCDDVLRLFELLIALELEKPS